MTRSTAHYIPYDIRPSKQIERRIILDILKAGSEVGLKKLSSYKYIGFGGFKFYDFEMLFRHLGIKDMTSIEQDSSLFSRCIFNRPFDFITIEESLFSTFLANTYFRKPVIAWLDYEWGISNVVIEDILTLGGKVPAGSFLFVTICAEKPKGTVYRTTDEHIADLKEELGDFSLIRNNEDIESANYPEYSARVLTAVVTTALSKRSDGQFLLLLRTLYSDTKMMLTVGACLCPHKVAEKFKNYMKRNFLFLSSSDGAPYRIPNFNFTLRERHLLDHIATSRRKKKVTRHNLQKIGIKASLINDYKHLVRFVPKYFESYI